MENNFASFKKILVTGGNGFIGGHVVDYLCDKGVKVTVLDRFSKPHRSDVHFVSGDIRNKELVEKLAQENDGIINLAAILGTAETISNPNGTISSNLHGAVNIFDCAKKFNIPVCHITVGNYWMNNPYAITKNAAEKIALFYNKSYGTKISVVRGLNAYGERQKSIPVRKIMPNLLIPALNKSEILIYGDGQQKMDMIYVKDLAMVLCEALVQNHNAWHTIFEAGSGEAPTVNEICSMVLAVTGPGAKVVHVPMRPGEPNGSVVIGDPKTLLPLKITTDQLVTLADGIKKTADFYLKNKDLFKENFIFR